TRMRPKIGPRGSPPNMPYVLPRRHRAGEAITIDRLLAIVARARAERKPGETFGSAGRAPPRGWRAPDHLPPRRDLKRIGCRGDDQEKTGGRGMMSLDDELAALLAELGVAFEGDEDHGTPARAETPPPRYSYGTRASADDASDADDDDEYA